jgi:hypothetical protein
MDSSGSPTRGEQKGSVWNGQLGCTCYHLLSVQPVWRLGTVCAADWRLVLEPVIARYRERDIALYLRADGALAKPEIYGLLEAEGIQYAIRLPANQVLERRIGHLVTRPVGRPPKKPVVWFTRFRYRAQGWPARPTSQHFLHSRSLLPHVAQLAGHRLRSFMALPDAPAFPKSIQQRSAEARR